MPPEHDPVWNEINNIKCEIKKLWEMIDKMLNRLPAWGTAIISVLTFLLGAALAFAGVVVSMRK